MSNTENVDIEIAKENILLSYKSGNIPLSAGSKEEFQRQINIKIEDKKDCQECHDRIKKEDESSIFTNNNNINNNIMMGFSVFIMCATFGMIAKHI